ncbi:MAG: hypothetical protein ACT4PP_06000 [Sporichthyaceae bacterium]
MSHTPLSRRLLPGIASAGALVLVAAALATPAAANESKKKPKYDFNNAAYSVNIRSAAIETYANIPREVPQEIGYSEIKLGHDIGDPVNRCVAAGAGYWLSEEVEEGVIEGGAAPVAEGQTRSDAAPFRNPTIKKVQRPEVSATGSTTERVPAFPANGNGPLWTAECSKNDTKGTATGDVINASGFRFAGSTSSGEVNTKTGLFTGTARAFIQGIDGAYDSMQSLMQIKFPVNAAQPTVTFRLSFFNSDPGNSTFSDEGFTFFGNDVPASEFVDMFNQQAKSFAEMGSMVGPAGLQILSPEVGVNQDSGRYEITAPSATGNFGLAAREGDVGGNFGGRFTSITFTGDNVTADQAS